MSKYLILGDVHAKWVNMANLIRIAVEKQNIDGIIQCGDFGMFSDVVKFLKLCMKQNKINIPLYFVDGNHEDHYFLKHQVSHKNLNKNNIFYQPRGTFTVLGGRVVGWIGGAFNVDRPQKEYEGLNCANYPTQEDVNTYLMNEENVDHVDLVVSHGCPGEIGIGLQGHPAFQPGVQMFISQAGHAASPIYDIGEMPLTTLWNRMKYKPKNWVFGHYHKHHDRIINGTHFYCTGETDDMKAVYFWDTDKNEIVAQSTRSLIYF